MSTISTFSGFTMARLGIMVSQKALEITGNNISNLNTPGYTRQSLDQRALYIGGGDRYASQFDVRVGAGALGTGVSQLRDPYLDIRYRNETAQVGFYDNKLAVLEQINMILDEVGKGNEDNGIIEAGFSEFLEQLQNMNTEHAGDNTYDSSVRSAAKNLVGWFNTFANKLDTLYKDTINDYKEELASANTILDSIRELNEQIRKAEISSGALGEAERKEGMIGERGQQALELRDERNVLIDKLSAILPIDVTYSNERIGAGMTVEKLTISLSGMKDAVLIDGIYGSQLSMQQVDDGTGKMIDDPYFKLQVSKLEDKRGELKRTGVGSAADKDYPLQLGDTALIGGSLQAMREMLTEKGEYLTKADQAAMAGHAKATIKRGIPYYQKVLDGLANKFASMFNEANTKDMNGNDFVADANKKPGNLFSISGDTNDAVGADGTIITAKNISISKSWADGTVRIVQSRDPNNTSSTANDNISHMITLMGKDDIQFKPSDIGGLPGDYVNDDPFFTGSFQGMLTDFNSTLGDDTKGTIEILNNRILSQEELSISRDSVSGVDLNDEAVSMMQFQKSYTAACRLLTTLDEVLDKLINGTGIAGR